MILLEYEAKGLMKQNGIPVDTGILYTAGNQPESYPVVIKSQVPVGGRGKLGGVKIAKNLTLIL